MGVVPPLIRNRPHQAATSTIGSTPASRMSQRASPLTELPVAFAQVGNHGATFEDGLHLGRVIRQADELQVRSARRPRRALLPVAHVPPAEKSLDPHHACHESTRTLRIRHNRRDTRKGANQFSSYDE